MGFKWPIKVWLSCRRSFPNFSKASITGDPN
jgi:hypothetical protein